MNDIKVMVRVVVCILVLTGVVKADPSRLHNKIVIQTDAPFDSARIKTQNGLVQEINSQLKGSPMIELMPEGEVVSLKELKDAVNLEVVDGLIARVGVLSLSASDVEALTVARKDRSSYFDESHSKYAIRENQLQLEVLGVYSGQSPIVLSTVRLKSLEELKRKKIWQDDNYLDVEGTVKLSSAEVIFVTAQNAHIIKDARKMHYLIHGVPVFAPLVIIGLGKKKWKGLSSSHKYTIGNEVGIFEKQSELTNRNATNLFYRSLVKTLNLEPISFEHK